MIVKRLSASIAAFAVLATGAPAASIVQTVYFQYSENGTSYGSYQQFDPGMGTLDEVLINVVGAADSGSLVFTNMTDQTISFTGTISFDASTDAGSQTISSSFAATLAPQDNTIEDIGGSFDLSATELGPDVSYWVGTGTRFPGELSQPHIEPSVWLSDPGIGYFLSYPGGIGGTETITYLYTPEPASWVMLMTAVLGWVATRLARRSMRMRAILD